MAVTQNFQVELRSTLTGPGTNYPIEMGGISGVLSVPVKSADTEHLHVDGGFSSDDFRSSKLITVTYVLRGTVAQVGDWSDDLATMWAPDTADHNLHVFWPTLGAIFFTGRPRGLDVDDRLVAFGAVRAQGAFYATDPTHNTA